MSTRYLGLAIAAAIALPVAGYAQDSSSTVTRAQVRAELVQLESVGYRSGGGNDPHYPADIQAAEAAVASQKSTESNVGSNVGGARSGSSASGNRVTGGPAPANAPFDSLYAHR
jgi:type II secretory pathway pseudopilin PulG